MQKRVTIFICGIFFAASIVEASPSYWDLFRVPVHEKKHNADITLNTENIFPMGDFGRNMEMGGGGTLGMHWQVGGWRLGFETGGWALFGKHSDYDDQRPVDHLLMVPLYGVFGYRFSPFNWLTLIPWIGVGASFDVLKYMDGGTSPLSPGESSEIWNIHQLGRAGLQIWFTFFDRFQFFIGGTYTTTIEYQDFSAGHLVSGQLGITWRY